MDDPRIARNGTRAGGRHPFVALALASVLPGAALVWPGSVPPGIVVLALIAWAGIFAVALVTTRAEERRRRERTEALAVRRHSAPRE